MIYISQIFQGPGLGQWHYRVHLSKTEDWSGLASTMDQAWKNAKALYRSMAP